MGNCLKTQLKENVNNDNLDVIGQVKIYIEPVSGADPNLYIKPTKAVDVECTDTLKVGGESSKTLLANQTNNLPVSGAGYLIIKDKYAIEEFYYFNVNTTVDILKLSFMTSLRLIRLSSTAYGSITSLINENDLSEIGFEDNRNITGDFANIKTEKLNNLRILTINSSNVYCDISVFSEKSLTDFNFNNAKNITGNIALVPNKELQTSIGFYNSGISGALEDYVSSAISSGKTTATDFRMTGAISQLTFNGVKQDISGLTASAPCYVSWDNTGKIAVKTGQYGVANTTHVYCKGYTQQEAEVAFPGKTIVRVDA